MSKAYFPNPCISVFEFMRKFPDEESAMLYIENLRWHGEPTCPICGSKKVSFQKNKKGRYFWCTHCHDYFTVRVGTMFHRSHIPLNKWLYAIYRVMTARKSISSLQLSKELGIRQPSAWYLLQRIREALGKNDDDSNNGAGANGNDFLKGIVEFDEAYIGGKNENCHECRKISSESRFDEKIKVVGIRERESGKILSH